MKFLILNIFLLVFSIPLFGRAPAVNPGFKVTSPDGKVTKDFTYINGKAVELSKIGFKGISEPTIKVKIKRPTPINLAPTFLMFFALSIPAFAWLFLRDEEEASSNQEIEAETNAEVFEVDFSTKKPDEKEIKKAS